MLQLPESDQKNLHISNQNYRFWFEFEIVQNYGTKIFSNWKEFHFSDYFYKFQSAHSQKESNSSWLLISLILGISDSLYQTQGNERNFILETQFGKF